MVVFLLGATPVCVVLGARVRPKRDVLAGRVLVVTLVRRPFSLPMRVGLVLVVVVRVGVVLVVVVARGARLRPKAMM